MNVHKNVLHIKAYEASHLLYMESMEVDPLLNSPYEETEVLTMFN